MTATWRDTLFVWQGNFDISNEPADKNFTWRGSWVGCPDCADAQTAPTPTTAAFAASPMKFQVAGVSVTTSTCSGDGRATGFYTVKLTQGSGWDLGEGRDKKRHVDTKHTLYFRQVRHGLVVAVGENEFGAFVSAGYLGGGSRVLTIGRRYLAEGDERAAWSVDELYERVLATDQGVLENPVGDFWRVGPWRTMDLHAAKLGAKGKGKRKRGNEADDTTAKNPELPALEISKEGFSPKLVLSWTQLGFPKVASKVQWVEQCCGCGNEIKLPTKACCWNPDEWTTEEPNAALGEFWYCSSECVVRKDVMDAWEAFGKQWLRKREHSGCFLKVGHTAVADAFWEAVRSNAAASKRWKDVGWHEDGDFMLEAGPGGDDARASCE